MPNPIVDQETFIRLWDQYQSVKELAKVLGCTERAVELRRRAIEKRQNTFLSSSDPRGDHYYKHHQITEQNARKHAEVLNGTVLVFSDAHFWPGVRTTAFRGLLHFIEQLEPKAIVCNGDAFDGASISRFPRIGWDSKPSVIEELKACQERLGEIEAVAKDAKLFWPIGNHDSRFETRIANTLPQFEGVDGMRLKDHFPNWDLCWSLWVNSDVVIKHRYKNGIHATRNNTLNAGKTFVTGHLHSLKVTPLDDYNGTRWGVDTGTLADPRGPQFVDYLEDAPTDWRSGFVVLTFRDGRLMWPEVANVMGPGKIDFRGCVVEV